MINYIKTRIIEPIEDNNSTAGWWILFFAVIIILRNFGDALMWTHTIGHSTHPSHGQYFSMLKIFNTYAHAHINFFLVTCCMLYLFTRVDILKITKVVIVFWIISWIVPISDYIITAGAGHPLLYGTDISGITHILVNTFNPFVHFERHSTGHRIEVFLYCVSLSLYIWIKTRNLLKTVSGFILGYAGFVFIVAFTPVLLTEPLYRIFPAFNSYLPPEIVNLTTLDKYTLTPGAIFTSDQRTGLLLMVPIIFFTFIWFKIYAKKNFIQWVKNIDWCRGLNYIALSSAGIIFGYWRMGGVIERAFRNPVDYYAAALLPAAVFFAYHHAIVLKGILVKVPHRSVKWAGLEEQKVICASFLFLSLFSAINISYWVLLYIIVFILLFYLSMLPPLRLEKIPVASDIIMALTYMFAFFAGFGLLADREAVHLLPGPLWRAAVLGFLLAGGLRYRHRLNRGLTAILIFAAFMTVPLFTGINIMFLPAVILGGVSAAAELKLEKSIRFISLVSIAYYAIILVIVKSHMAIAL